MALPKTGGRAKRAQRASPKNTKKARKKPIPKNAGGRARAPHLRRGLARLQLALPKTGASSFHACPACGNTSERYATAAPQFPHKPTCRLRRRKARVARWVVEVGKEHDTIGHGGNRVTYQRELVRCGKPNCKGCKSGGGHGPYWYAYWSEFNRTRQIYIGKKLKPAREVLAAKQQKKREAA